MKRVLLVQPPIEDFYTTPIRLYPLGLLYVAGALKASGTDIAILDCLSPLKKRPLKVPDIFSYLAPHLRNPLFFRGYYRFGLSDKDVADCVESQKPDWIGISSQFTAYYSNIHRLAGFLKSKNSTPIVLGGNHATVFADEIRQKTPAVDFVLTGPAELGLPDFLEGEGVFMRAARHLIDWRAVQPPHDLLDPERYKIGKKRYMSLTASRGCPFRCEFCSVHRMFGREIEYRPVDSVLEEMRLNALQRGIRIFNFEDDNLSFDRAWFLDFLRSVAADPVLKGIELTAMNGLCSPTLDEEVLREMAGAGFRQLNLSFVTQNVSLRDKYKRPRAAKDFEELIRAAQALGFFVTVYVIIGLPGQTFAEIKESIDYLLGLNVLVGPSVFYLPPGSDLYEKIAVVPEVRDNWDFYRSSAFAVETDELSRAQLIGLFLYARRRNLEGKRKPLT